MRRFPTVDRFGLSLLLALGFAGCQDATSEGTTEETLQDSTSGTTSADTSGSTSADTSGVTTSADTSGTVTAADTSGITTAADTSGTTTSADTSGTTTEDTNTPTDTTTAEDTNTPTDATDTGDVPVTVTDCGVSTPILSASGEETGYERCESGALHRVKAVTCTTTVPRPEACVPSGSDPGTCHTDADCPTHATCDADPWFGGCVCTQGCATDADCGDGYLCRCGEPTGRCEWTGCTTDADCGDGLLCIEQLGCEFGGPQRFACQTAQDTCDDQGDCGPFDPFGGPFCMKPGDDQPFQCFNPGCAVPGRPFLVEDSARLASVEVRSDWNEPGLCPSLEGFGPAQLQTLATHWTRIGLMEHASVAAFARSAMQLMALGAPPALLVDTQRAMSDETRHARQAFALASAYAGAPVGPGPLCMDGALGDVDLRAVLEITIHEGCIGETVAAIEAAEAAERVQDPVVKAVLLRIAEDEGNHAALAWRTVQWALSLGGDDLRAHVRALFEEATRKSAPQAIHPHDEASARLGVVEGSLSAELKRQALQRVIAPCAGRLLGGVGQRVSLGVSSRADAGGRWTQGAEC